MSRLVCPQCGGHEISAMGELEWRDTGETSGYWRFEGFPDSYHCGACGEIDEPKEEDSPDE